MNMSDENRLNKKNNGLTSAADSEKEEPSAEKPERLSRREFFKKSASFGAAAAGAFLLSRTQRLFSQSWRLVPGEYDLVALIGGEPDEMFDRGVRELGGIEQFVNRRDTVVIKPNMSWHSAPEEGGNTNPKLIGRIVEHCINAGAKRVYLFDNTLSRNSYQVSGIEKAASEAGGQLVPAKAERYYQQVEIKGAQRLTEVKVHELLLEADAFINVPVLKHHGSTHLTVCMKNLMGCVWDRWYYHRNNLDRCIAEFTLLRKPTLNVVDAYRVMKNGGPSGRGGADILLEKMQILSTDIVAADAAAAAQGEMWGIYGAGRVEYIDIAHQLGVGNKNMSELNIKRISL